MLLVFLSSACPTLYYYLTLFRPYKMLSLSTNNLLTALYLSIIRFLYAPFPLPVWFRSHSGWSMGLAANT